MNPITVMRNGLGMDQGGSGKLIKREEYVMLCGGLTGAKAHFIGLCIVGMGVTSPLFFDTLGFIGTCEACCIGKPTLRSAKRQSRPSQQTKNLQLLPMLQIQNDTIGQR